MKYSDGLYVEVEVEVEVEISYTALLHCVCAYWFVVKGRPWVTPMMAKLTFEGGVDEPCG